MTAVFSRDGKRRDQLEPDDVSPPGSEAALSLAAGSSSRAEQRWALALIGFLVLLSTFAVPLHQRAFADAPAFILAFAATTGGADLLTAALLFALYRADGARGVLLVAAAYLLDAFLIAPYALTFPGILGGGMKLGSEQSSAWLWLGWHFAFPAILLFAVRAGGKRRSAARLSDIIRAVTLVAGIAAVGVILVTSDRMTLPVLVWGDRFSPLFQMAAALAAGICTLVAWAFIADRQPLSTMRLWLVVALVASICDTALNAIAPARYSLGWYVGKLDTFVTAGTVLGALLAAWSSMYSRMSALTLLLRGMMLERRSLQDSLARERHVSLTLQRASLPRRLPCNEHVRMSAAYVPGSDEATIGGDWYDAFVLDDGRIAVTIGDVMGSGLRAAVMMTKIRGAMQAAAMLQPDPVAMLEVAERTLRLHDPDGYATALALVYDPLAQRAIFAAAGHVSPLLRLPDGTIREHRHDGIMLGASVATSTAAQPVSRSQPTSSIETPPGSMLVLYTDGMIEFSRDVLDGERRLAAALAQSDAIGCEEPAQALVRRVLQTRKAVDDIAVLTLHFRHSR